MGTTEAIEAAIRAHGEWKSRLVAAADAGLGDIDPAKVKLDDQCAFGKWLYGEGRSHIADPKQHDHIRELHAEFHRAAGAIADQIAAGSIVDARVALGFGGPLARWSSQLEQALTRLKSL